MTSHRLFLEFKEKHTFLNLADIKNVLSWNQSEERNINTKHQSTTVVIACLACLLSYKIRETRTRVRQKLFKKGDNAFDMALECVLGSDSANMKTQIILIKSALTEMPQIKSLQNLFWIRFYGTKCYIYRDLEVCCWD